MASTLQVTITSAADKHAAAIFGMAGATCTQRVLMACFENDAEYNLNLVDFRKGEHKEAAHLARQPFGQIPALEDADFSMYESRAICRYIDATRGGKLTPVDAKARGLMEQWISLEQGTITPEIIGIVSQRIFVPFFGGVTDETIVAKHVEAVQKGLDVMDAHLAKNEYLAGATFSLADVFFMPYFGRMYFTPEKTLFESRPNITAWWKRVSERPSWPKVLALSEFK